MESFTFMCCCIQEAEGGQYDSQQAGGGQEDSEQAGPTSKEVSWKGDCTQRCSIVPDI